MPRQFKIRVESKLTDTSTGTIAAFESFDGAISLAQIHSMSERYNHVIVYMCEPYNHGSLTNFVQCCPENVTVFTDVILDKEPARHRHVANWFMIHQNLYADCCWAPGLFAELQQDITAKPYCFDALLGVRRPHRELIYSAWQKSQYQDRILLTYHGNDARRGIWHVPFTAELCEHTDTAAQGALAVTLWSSMPQSDGSLTHKVGTQNLIPVQIYNDTWYSIIAEGFIDSQGTRVTEKTAKALVSERAFVYFGAPHDLARLRRLGFETFGDVIDESYDSILDDTARWQAAWQQVEWLCQQDPQKILAATQSQRQHNRQVFLNTDWYRNLREHLREICAK